MGTYCEIKRELIEEDFNKESKERKVQLWRNANVGTKTTPNWFVKTSSVSNPFLLSSSLTSSSHPSKYINPTNKSIQLKKNEYIQTYLCQPNPCMNEAKCEVEIDTFKCICKNASFSGTFCENFRFIIQDSLKKTSLEINTTTISFVPTTSPTTITRTSELKKINQKDPLSYYTRAFFWQCPSNCLFHLGRGFCTLSSSGYPRCSCRDEWTGVDCAQKNYCLNNDCQNNSTCSNYPEMKYCIFLISKNVNHTVFFSFLLALP